MAAHSSILVWEIPWTEEPGRLQSMGLQRAGHDLGIKQEQNYISITLGASLIAQLVKNLPAVQKTWVRFLGWEDPLEKEMAAHSSILVWKIPWTTEPGRLRPWGRRVGRD